MNIVLALLTVMALLWIINVITKSAVPKPQTRLKKPALANTTWCKNDKYYYINTNETEICPFCKSKKIFSGATATEYCENCGASHMLGVWIKSKE